MATTSLSAVFDLSHVLMQLQHRYHQYVPCLRKHLVFEAIPLLLKAVNPRAPPPRAMALEPDFKGCHCMETDWQDTKHGTKDTIWGGLISAKSMLNKGILKLVETMM